MKNKLLLFAKGLAMGAADIIPGVSGGTIAFITGIYEELLYSLKQLNVKNLRILFKDGFSVFFRKTNALFLIVLSSGIAISILSLARGIKYMLLNHSILIMAFFFGLIVASILIFMRKITHWNWKIVLAILFGSLISFFITITKPFSSPDSYVYLFFSGFLAIIAMILPGISGAFILLLMGSYYSIINALDDLRIGVFSMDFDRLINPVLKVICFGCGALIGLLLFANALSWLFQKYRQLAIAVLNGFLIGSLNKVWPWKKIISYRLNSGGESVPFLEQNISPFAMTVKNHFVYALVIALVGFSIIYILERVFEKKSCIKER